jgi:glycosyltransferase involved in cell wall biosynthesis
MDISIVIPIYFNQGSILTTCEKINNLFNTSFNDLTFEIILVDDGSKDKSFNEMQLIQNNYDNVQIIKFTRNFGQVAAIYAGYQKAKGKGILNIAADLQEPISLISEMIKSFILKEAKIIAGQRIGRDESLYRKYSSLFFYTIMKKLSFEKLPKGGFDIVLIHSDVKNTLLDLNEVNPFWQGQLLWTGYPIKFIPYKRLKRDIGKSKWTFSKKIKYLLDGVLAYSYAPLRLFSFIGIITFILGILYSFLIIIQYFLGSTPFKGWTPIMIVILLFSGIQLVMLGLIGEYLWRNSEQTKKRPTYIIEE